jgi:RimJ/RimL family protein N-acetyltransferase
MIHVVLETKRLLLRRFRREDVDDYLRAVADPEVMRFINHGRAWTREETVAALERYEQRWDENGVGHFAIERRDDGRVIGRVGVVFWDPEVWTIADSAAGMQPELGWLLARDAWGFGYATEAALAARSFAFESLRPSSLISVIAPENSASQAVAERLGATRDRRVELSEWGPADVWVHPR